MLDPSPDVTSSTYKCQQLPASFFLKVLSGPCIVEQTGKNRELIPQDRPSNDEEWKLVDKYPSHLPLGDTVLKQILHRGSPVVYNGDPSLIRHLQYRLSLFP